MITEDRLRAIMPEVPDRWAKAYADAAQKTAERFEINTPRRAAAWLANIAYESAELNHWEEVGQGGGLFGNYYGRGPIQLTGIGNYRAAGSFLSLDLVNDPGLVSRDTTVGFDTAGWFWRHGNGDLNVFADSGDFWTCYIRVLGSDNGTYDEREAFYNAALKALTATEYPSIDLIVQNDQWLTNPEGTAWARLKDHGDAVVQTDSQGWLWSPGAKPEPVDWKWPEAWAPVVWDGTYIGEHPTRYFWREDVEKVARAAVNAFPGRVWANTYVRHPPGWNRDTTSIDFWDYSGRGNPINLDIGDRVFDFVFNDPNPPWIEWCIWKGWIWTPSGGWKVFIDDGTGPHWDHSHFTFT